MGNQLVSLSSAVELLKQLGLKVDVIDAHSIAIGKEKYRVLTRQTVPSPALVQAQGKAGAAWLVPRLTRGLRVIAGEALTSCFIGMEGEEVWIAGKPLSVPAPKPLSPRTKGRSPWAKFAIMRALAQNSIPRTQSELALSLGITQPAVSQSLSTMNQLVEKTSAGWVARDFDLIAREFLDSYPGPGGAAVGWLSLEPVIKQAESVLASHSEVILSSDAAADQIAPWRLPRTAVVYSPRGLDLKPLGFTEAPLESATLKVVVPADPHILRRAPGAEGHLADGLQVAFDLTQASGSDAWDSSEHLLEKLRQRWGEAKD